MPTAGITRFPRRPIMKVYLIIAAALAVALVVAACDRGATPTDTGPRAVTGMVEVRLGDLVQRYAVRVDRSPTGFATALRPLGAASLPPDQLAAIPFVRDEAVDAVPLVFETPHGTVATRFAYRPLGPWQVLDHAVTSIRVRTPAGERSVDLEVALRAPRLER
jgi:hypothetical protein